MKKPKFNFLLIIVLINILFIGCNSHLESSIESENSTSKSTTISTAIYPKEIRSATPSKVTVFPPTANPTSEPTLNHEEMEKIIGNLLISNGGCNYPCVWGFTPGLTQENQISDKFLIYGWDIKPYPILDGNVYYTGKDLSDSLSVRFAYYVNNEIVQSISLTFTHPQLESRDQIMSIASIFDIYEEPDQSWLSLNLGGEASVEIIEQAGFDFYLFYGEPLFLIIYSGYAIHQNDKFSFCLLSENQQNLGESSFIDSITIYSGSENIKKSPKGIIEPFGKFNGQKSIDEAVNMSTNELFRMIGFEQKKPCFTTSDNIWQK